MRKIFTFFAAIILATTLWAQSPEKMSYQAVIRNSSDALVTNTQIGMQVSILQGSATGIVVYTETQTPTTNANGLVSIEIGGGTGFNAIDWSAGPYFIETKTDPTGGTNYTITGTSQLLSVPYALHAKTAVTVTGGITETDPTFTSSQAANITAIDITNLSNLSGINTGDQDLSNFVTTTALTNGLDAKVDKVTGKGLSTEDYTTAEKTKLAGIAAGAEVNVQADWNQATNTADDFIRNKPVIPPAQVQTNWTATTGMGVLLNKPAHIDEDKTDDVTLTGNQTIGGIKTFTGTTVFTGRATVASPVDATDAATKDYVDAIAGIILGQLSSKGVIVADVDGNFYSTVRIGSQVWMAENLKTTKYADGTAIPLVTGTSNWDTLTATSKAYCWYDDYVANKATYGALYTWAAAMNGAVSVTANPSGVQGVCPTGWHLPSDTELTQLSTYLGGESVAGGKLKETGTTHWTSPNTGATNETGFTALPGGNRYVNGSFERVGDGYWWSATEGDATHSWSRAMYNLNSSVSRNGSGKEMGFSVRCVRD